MEKRDFSPEEYDVLIGHCLQAHNRDYIEDRYVAIDEFPDDAYRVFARGGNGAGRTESV